MEIANSCNFGKDLYSELDKLSLAFSVLLFNFVHIYRKLPIFEISYQESSIANHFTFQS